MNDAGVLGMVIHSISGRVVMCIPAEGGHFKQVLQNKPYNLETWLRKQLRFVQMSLELQIPTAALLLRTGLFFFSLNFK
jgi:hypothetical protein